MEQNTNETPRVDDYPEDLEDGYLYRGKMYRNLGDKFRAMIEDKEVKQ